MSMAFMPTSGTAADPWLLGRHAARNAFTCQPSMTGMLQSCPAQPQIPIRSPQTPNLDQISHRRIRDSQSQGGGGGDRGGVAFDLHLPREQ